MAVLTCGRGTVLTTEFWRFWAIRQKVQPPSRNDTRCDTGTVWDARGRASSHCPLAERATCERDLQPALHSLPIVLRWPWPWTYWPSRCPAAELSWPWAQAWAVWWAEDVRRSREAEGLGVAELGPVSVSARSSLLREMPGAEKQQKPRAHFTGSYRDPRACVTWRVCVGGGGALAITLDGGAWIWRVSEHSDTPLFKRPVFSGVCKWNALRN